MLSTANDFIDDLLKQEQNFIGHYGAVKLKSELLSCYQEDFMTIEIKTKKSLSPFDRLIGLFLVRYSLLDKMFKNGKITLVNNMDTVKVLKTFFGKKYEIFDALLNDRKITYSGEEFYKKYDKLFSIFGDLRSFTAITWDGALKSFFTLGLSKEVDESVITPCANTNLYYMALLMRKILQHSISEIKSITFETKRAKTNRIIVVNSEK